MPSETSATASAPAAAADTADVPVEQAPPALYSSRFWAAAVLGGVASCGLTHLATVPLDVVKCRMQTDPARYRSVVGGLALLVRTSGVRGLALGWAPTLLGYGAQGAFRFSLFEFFRRAYYNAADAHDADAHKRFALSLAAAASAEVLADLPLAPFEALKVRIQTRPDFPSTLRAALPLMYRTEGLHGFYKGLAPLLSRQVPYTMIKFASFESVVESIYRFVLTRPKSEYTRSEHLAVSFAGGFVAGALCAIASHPGDTIVSKLNSVRTDGSTLQAIGAIFKEIGFRGVWRGLGARMLMIGTIAASQWLIYDSVKVVFG